MPRADRSVAILTGMIIAALYVILLVGFSQESYMRRESHMRQESYMQRESYMHESGMQRDAACRVDGPATWAVIHDVSKRLCRLEPPLCAGLFSDAGDRQTCISSIEAARRLVSAPVMPLTLEGLRRAMRLEP
jgi:hypothetical protein